MRVQRVLMPDSARNEHVPVEPVEQFLAYLTSIEKSPNTVKAYAHDLKDRFVYLTGDGYPRLEDPSIRSEDDDLFFHVGQDDRTQPRTQEEPSVRAVP
jgi:site-specific recombinase XerD